MCAAALREGAGENAPLERSCDFKILPCALQNLGFFLVEDFVMNTTSRLISTSAIADLWRSGMLQICMCCCCCCCCCCLFVALVARAGIRQGNW